MASKGSRGSALFTCWLAMGVAPTLACGGGEKSAAGPSGSGGAFVTSAGQGGTSTTTGQVGPGGSGGSLGTSSTTGTTVGVLSPALSPPGGTFAEQLEVSLEGAAGAQAYYTLDGSLPAQASEPFVGPILLTASTEVRVLVVGADQQQTLLSQAYIRLADDIASFTSNLPLAVVHTHDQGELDQDATEMVPASLAVYELDGQSTGLVGPADLQTRIGIRVRGETSREFPKKQYAVEFRAGPDDSDFDLPLLGMPAESDWVFSAPIEFDRALMRNALAFEMSRAIGRQASRTRFAEVFLVDDGGDLAERHYLGVYILMEKIKRGPERVNVSSLGIGDLVEPAVSGGYIFRDDKGDPDFEAGGLPLQFVYPDSEALQDPTREPQVDYLSEYIDSFVRAIESGDHVDADTGRHYSELIDVDAWIDHNIINALSKNVDGLRLSAYFHKERGGLMVAGPVWDFDRSLGTPYDERATEPREWKSQGTDGTDYFGHGWWQWLFQDPEFEQRYWQRFAEVLNGPLSTANLHAMIDRMASEIGPAADRNFERWRERPPLDDSHAAEVQLLKDFLSARVEWIQGQIP